MTIYQTVYILNTGIDKIATYTETQEGNRVQNKENNKLHKQEGHHQRFKFPTNFGNQNWQQFDCFFWVSLV
jgi:hypothetical protein